MFGGLFDLDGDGELEAWEMALCEAVDRDEIEEALEELWLSYDEYIDMSDGEKEKICRRLGL